MEHVPPDVAIARAVQGLTRALLVMTVAVLVLALIGVGALSLAGEDRSSPPLTAGLSLLGIGQLAALAGAALSGLGLIRVLRGVGEPGSNDSATAGRSRLPQVATRTTATRLALLLRITLGAVVLVIAVWAIANPDGILGAIVGAIVAIQVVVAIAIVRVQLLRSR
ncbi:MAG: hypothetical protein ACK5KU_01025 [Beutenbergiaceae bacterium]